MQLSVYFFTLYQLHLVFNFEW